MSDLDHGMAIGGIGEAELMGGIALNSASMHCSVSRFTSVPAAHPDEAFLHHRELNVGVAGVGTGFSRARPDGRLMIQDKRSRPNARGTC